VPNRSIVLALAFVLVAPSVAALPLPCLPVIITCAPTTPGWLAWEQRAPSNSFNATAISPDGSVVVLESANLSGASPSYGLRGVEWSTGHTLWTLAFASPPAAFALDSSRVYVTTTSYEALNTTAYGLRNGTLAWAQTNFTLSGGESILVTPSWVGTVEVDAFNGHETLLRYAPANGTLLGTLDTGIDFYDHMVGTDGSSVVFVGTNGSSAHGLNAFSLNGTLLWSTPLPDTLQFFQMGGPTFIYDYFQWFGPSRIGAVNLTTGAVAWDEPEPSFVESLVVSADGRTVEITHSGDYFYPPEITALDGATGATRWTTSFSGDSETVAVSANASRTYVSLHIQTSGNTTGNATGGPAWNATQTWALDASGNPLWNRTLDHAFPVGIATDALGSRVVELAANETAVAGIARGYYGG